MRNRAEKRHNDWKKAIRKRRIDREKQGTSNFAQDTFDNLHQYSKSHVFCGCGLCKRYGKTNNKSPRKRKIHANYAPSKNWSARDERRITEMEDQMLDNE